MACERNHRFVTQVLLRHRASLHLMTDDGETPLIMAAKHGALDVLEELAGLDLGASVAAQDSPEGNTALHYILYSGHRNIADKIVRRYPEVLFIRNTANETPLSYANTTDRDRYRHLYGKIDFAMPWALNSPLFRDTVLRLNSKHSELTCHSQLLLARCPTLQLMPFTAPPDSPLAHPLQFVLDLPCGRPTATHFIHWLYTDELGSPGPLPKLHSLARELKLPSLKALAEGTERVSLSDSLARMRDIAPDLEVRVQNKSFPVHRFLLSEYSEVFRSMLASGFDEGKQSQVTLEEVEPGTFAAVLHFLYRGALADSIEDLTELFATAHKFIVKNLIRVCESTMAGLLALPNALTILEVADLFQAFDYVVSHYEDFGGSQFLKVPAHLMLEITRSVQGRVQRRTTKS